MIKINITIAEFYPQSWVVRNALMNFHAITFAQNQLFINLVNLVPMVFSVDASGVTIESSRDSTNKGPDR